MTYFTSTEISDLDNSMVAAQNVKLGTVLDNLVNGSGSTSYVTISGSFTPSAPVTQVASGLAHVVGLTVSMTGSPTSQHMWTTANTGSAPGGSFYVYCWQPTNASLVYPVLASTGSTAEPYARVCWIARGLTT